MTVLYGNKPLPHGTKSAVILDFLEPEYQNTADPDYMGMEFLLQTYLPEGNYSVYDVELIGGWVDYAGQLEGPELRARTMAAEFEQIAEFKHYDIYHTMLKQTQEDIWCLAYSGCSAHGQLVIYFIKD